jgi:hypothetical protein
MDIIKDGLTQFQNRQKHPWVHLHIVLTNKEREGGDIQQIRIEDKVRGITEIEWHINSTCFCHIL